MSKYIDAEKLKTHIQYLIKKDNYELFDVPELLSFIDSLQQEQQEADLEKEMEAYFGENWKDGTPIEVQDDLIKFASHFFELGLNARK